MASTYSALKIELIGTGEQAGTWGVTTNTNLGTAIEEAITGSANVTFANATVTLTLSDADAVGPFNISSAQTLYVVATASSSGTANVQSGDYQARSEGFARTVDAALIPLVIADRVP